MTLPDFFDVNGPGSDSHLQFMNWTVDNNGAWDYAADTRGYTVGGMAEYDDRIWSIRYGLFAMPIVANGIDMDWAFSRAHGQNGEFELRHSFVPRAQGTRRACCSYANRAHMGTYREAVEDFLNGTDTAKYGITVPTITLHEHFSALKYGFGYNTEQELTANLRVFGRFGWNEGQHESFAYTEVDQTVQAGADYAGTRWHRPVDKIGLAVVSNAIKRDHQNYLKPRRPWVSCWATATSTMAAKILWRATTTGTRGGACSMPSTCSTSITLATIATAVPHGLDRCGRTWIFEPGRNAARVRRSSPGLASTPDAFVAAFSLGPSRSESPRLF